MNEKKIKRFLKRIFFVSAFLGLVCALFVAYELLGPRPWKDSNSRYANEQLKIALGKKQAVDLKSLFLDIDNKTGSKTLLIMPSYTLAHYLDCSDFSSDFLKNLQIRSAVEDGLCRLVIFDSSGVIDAITLNSSKFFCNKYPPPLCIPLDGAILVLDENASSVCYRVSLTIPNSEKEM